MRPRQHRDPGPTGPPPRSDAMPARSRGSEPATSPATWSSTRARSSSSSRNTRDLRTTRPGPRPLNPTPARDGRLRDAEKPEHRPRRSHHDHDQPPRRGRYLGQRRHRELQPFAHRALATLRIAFGLTFLWAFFDKTVRPRVPHRLRRQRATSTASATPPGSTAAARPRASEFGADGPFKDFYN